MHNMAGHGRTTWAAIGAAVAVTLGAGGIGVVRATVSSGDRPIFVSITPCRLVDTRPAPSTVGSRNTPLNPAEIATFTVHGTNGNCTIPAGALAIDANVTITAPTSDGFLTMFPADAPLPNASNLNWSAGQAPTPNAVSVDLSADGRVNVFNERGTVNVIIDIAGYYEDHNHDDRYLRAGPIITNHSGLDWVATSFTPPIFDKFVTRLSMEANGSTTMPLDAPVSFDGVAYRLSSVQYCVWSVTMGARVDSVQVWSDTGSSGQGLVTDGADRTAPGCYTVAVPAPPAVPLTWQLNLSAAGGAGLLVGLSSVQATWIPAGVGGASAAPTAAGSSGNGNGD
jgi:hypothetical protein